MPKVYSSVEVARELGISPNYVTRFLKANKVERTLGIYVVDEATLKRLTRARAKQAAQSRGAAWVARLPT